MSQHYSDEARAALKERFRKVILGAGYKSADGILAEYFDKYMEDPGPFMEMLGSYEKDQHERNINRT